jgi:ferredoxin
MMGISMDLLGLMVLFAALTSAYLLARSRGGDRPRGFRFNILKIPLVRRLVRHRLFQPFLQALPLTLFVAVLWAGLYGTPVPERNLATVLTWGIWWVLLIVDIVLLGRMWCTVCPWEAVAGFVRRLSFWRRTDEPLALNRPWPRWARNVYPATILFLGLTWLELGYGVTFSPRGTALLGLAMLMVAVLSALFFDKRSFCKYGCLVGRICGLYSMMAPVEVRAVSVDVCATCRTKDCVFGNELGYPCPTSQYPAKMDSNAYCTVCTECVKSCPHENVAINLRPLGEDLEQLRRPRMDEALLAVIMLAMTSFHGLTMTPIWRSFMASLRFHLELGPLGCFSLGMLLALLVPILVFYLGASRAARLGASPERQRRYFLTMAYPLIALALLYHLAHNAGHFFVEGGRILSVLSDPVGRGWDLFGTASFQFTPMLTTPVIWGIQLLLVLVGHWSATAVCLRLSFRFPGGPHPDQGRDTMAAMLLFLTSINLWLLAQPMEMRTGL